MFDNKSKGYRAIEMGATPQQVTNWLDRGMLIQDAMPNLSDDEREYAMTGISASQWDEMFGGDV